MQELHDFLRAELEDLNRLITDSLKNTRVPLITEIACHIMAAGGKRLRPLLTFLCAGMCDNKDHDRMIRLGACIEFIHTATLLHDDVIDQSNQRRGRPSAHTLWGNEASVLVGDFLFSRAFELMVEDDSSEVFKILSQTASKISEGELLQLTYAHSVSLNEDIYMDIIGAKTASLFAAACEIGALAAHSSDDQRTHLRALGYKIGLLFQISDDILDFCFSSIDLGKNAGDDLFEGKMTLPLILAYKTSNANEKSLIEDTLSDSKKFKKNFPLIKEIILQSPAIESTLTYARAIQQDAFQHLLLFRESPQKKLLEKIVHFSLNRCDFF